MEEFSYPESKTAEGMAKAKPGISLNYKRVLGRALHFWYLIACSLVLAVTVAYLFNRYTKRIYPVTASIIVREGEENSGAKFLYNNALVNPYRNFYNELYILRSYPLLQQVVTELNFTVAFYREGNIKTTEYYEPTFPISLHVLPSASMPWGRSMEFRVESEDSFSLEYLGAESELTGTRFSNLHFNDTLSVNGFRLYAEKRSPVNKIQDKNFIVRFKDPFNLARSYAGRLNATWAMPGASVVNLDITGEVTQKEMDFLNKFIEKYQEYDVAKKNKVATKSLEFLDTQLKLMGDSLRFFEQEMENFKHENNAIDLNSQGTRLYQRLEGLESQKVALILQQNYLDYLGEYLTVNNDYSQIVAPSAIGVNDEVLVKLINDLISLQTEITLFEGGARKDANPIVAEKKKRIAQAKLDILEGIKSVKSSIKINDKFINDQIRLVEKGLNSLPGAQRKLITIQRNYSLHENLYIFLMQKRAEAGISRASTTSDIVVVNPPVAGGPITPKSTQNLIIAVVVGLLIPFVGFAIAEVMNDRIQSKEDIDLITTIPVIGGIGHNPNDNSKIVYNKPKSALAESFRSLRSNLNYFTGGKDKKIFMVASSISGEGKTFTTINLATVLAFSIKRTLIIGADMRKPKIFNDFDLSNDVGLSTYLAGLAPLDDVIQHTGIENLDLISGGPVPPNPSELLLNPRMKDLLDILLKTYDYIILDTSPIALVTDAFALLPFVDHTIYLIRQNYTPRAVLQNVQELYDRGKIKNISIVFNDIAKTGAGYGYGNSYGYGYGYGYGGYGYGYLSNSKNKDKDKHGGYYTE